MAKTVKPLRLLTALLCAACSALLIWQCLKIFFAGGDTPYTAQNISRALKTCLPVALLLSASAVFTGILSLKYGSPKEKFRPDRQYLLTAALSRAGEAGGEEIRKAKRRVFFIKAGGGFIALVLLIPFAAYLMGKAHFETWDLNAMALSLLKNALPWVFASVAALILTYYWTDREAAKLLEKLKKQPKTAFTPERENRFENSVLYIRLVLLLAAVLLIALGAANGGARDVLAKAKAICMECIGLG